jgi:3'-5' exoribonuclease
MNKPELPFAVTALAGEVRQAIGAIAEPVQPSEESSGVWDEPAPEALAEHLRAVMRIVSLERTMSPDVRINSRAVLFHESCSMSVDWDTQHVDSRLHRHGLVTIRPAQPIRCSNGAIRIQRLLPVDRPLASENLFRTIPNGWCKDRALVARAIALWDALPRPLAHLVNAVLWGSGRFHRFVMGPSSLNGHHNGWNGNFRHSVEVAEQSRDMGEVSSLANVPLLIAAGLLHDAGKADEYTYDRALGAFHLSTSGELIGHRDTLVGWLAVARAMEGVMMPDDLYLALCHTIHAVSHAPRYLGLREPRCIEAEILSMTDRLSGGHDLHLRNAPADGEAGFGRYHRHLGHRTFLTPRVSG